MDPSQHIVDQVCHVYNSRKASLKWSSVNNILLGHVKAHKLRWKLSTYIWNTLNLPGKLTRVDLAILMYSFFDFCNVCIPKQPCSLGAMILVRPATQLLDAAKHSTVVRVCKARWNQCAIALVLSLRQQIPNELKRYILNFAPLWWHAWPVPSLPKTSYRIRYLL